MRDDRTRELKQADPKLEADKIWIKDELIKRGYERPWARLDGKGIWQVHDGHRMIGRIPKRFIDARDADELAKVEHLHGSVMLMFSVSALEHRKSKRRPGPLSDEEQTELNKREQCEEKKKKKAAKAAVKALAEGKALPDETKKSESLKVGDGREPVPPDGLPNRLLRLMVNALRRAQRRVVEGVIGGEEERQTSGKVDSTYYYHVAKAEIDQYIANEHWLPGDRERWHGINTTVIQDASLYAYTQATDWKKRKRSEAGPPWYKNGTLAVPMRSFDLEYDGSAYYLQFRLWAKDDHHLWPPIRVRANCGKHAGSAYAILRKLRTGEYRQRAGTLKWNEDTRKWEFRISYTYPPPPEQEGSGTLLVRPSLNSFVRMYGSDAVMLPRFDCARFVHTMTGFTRRAQDENRPRTMLQAKAQFDQAKRDRRAHFYFAGTGARGHGLSRRYEIYRQLGRKERNFVRDWWIQQAKFCVQKMAEHHYKEGWWCDFSKDFPVGDDRIRKLINRFPFAFGRDIWLREMAKAGYRARVVQYRSGCPACGETDPKGNKIRFDVGKRMVKCLTCGMEADADAFAAWRTFQSYMEEGNAERVELDREWKRRLEQMQRIREQVKKAREHGVEEDEIEVEVRDDDAPAVAQSSDDAAPPPA